MSYITRVYYAGLVYHEHLCINKDLPFSGMKRHDLPDGCYIRVPDGNFFSGNKWYLKDLTPVLIEDVPKELLLLDLLLK